MYLGQIATKNGYFVVNHSKGFKKDEESGRAMRCSAVLALVIIVAIVHGTCERASSVTDVFHSTEVSVTFMLQSVRALRRRAASALAKTGHRHSSKRTSR